MYANVAGTNTARLLVRFGSCEVAKLDRQPRTPFVQSSYLRQWTTFSFLSFFFSKTKKIKQKPVTHRTSTVAVHDAFTVLQVQQLSYTVDPRQRLTPGRMLSNVDKLSMTSGW